MIVVCMTKVTPLRYVVFVIFGYLALLSCAYSFCVSPQETPNASYQGKLCQELKTFFSNASNYFHSNTILYFLPGQHIVDIQGTLTIKNVENISLVGVEQITASSVHPFSNTMQPVASLTCRSPWAMVFDGVSNLKILNLAILNCGATWTTASTSAVVHLHNVSDCVIGGLFVGMSFLSSINASVGIAVDSSRTVVTNSKFTLLTKSITISNGGTLHVTDSCFRSSLTGIEVTGLDHRPYLTIDRTKFYDLLTGVFIFHGFVNATNCTFHNLSTAVNHSFGGVHARNSQFTSNGYGIISKDSTVMVQRCSFFDMAKAGMQLIYSDCYVKNSNITHSAHAVLVKSAIVTMTNCNIIDNRGTAIIAQSALIRLTESVNFVNGTSVDHGGAVYLSDAKLFLIAPANVSFINNSAAISGGAIYVEYQPTDLCFLQIDDINGTFQNPGVHLNFFGNHAQETGNVMHATFSCSFNRTLIPNYATSDHSAMEIFERISSILSTAGDANNSFSWIARAVMLKGHINCLTCASDVTVPTVFYPGQTTVLTIITIDEYCRPAPGVAVVTRDDHDTSIEVVRTSILGANYSIVLTGGLSTIRFQTELNADYITEREDCPPLRLQFSMAPCPLGFEGEGSNGLCVCSRFFQETNVVSCDISTVMITKLSSSWIGVTAGGKLAFSEACPLRYCNLVVDNVSLDRPNEQCKEDRTGLFCSRCPDNLSEVFGDSHCRPCTNNYLWLVLAFALLGVALIAFLLLTNMTVSIGTLNGFIFYANIIKVNELILYPLDHKGTFLQILWTFVSWLNLDFGIVTCFYDGMNSYAKTWLQFVFPTYLLLLVVLIILAARRSAFISRLCKHNVIPVLASLILLSYSKLLKNTIAIFSYKRISVEGINGSDEVRTVWQYDGDIRYLRGIHIPLFICALLLALLFIVPYTLLLLLAPCLQRVSSRKGFFWVDRIKPLLDAYQGPYRFNHRFWTGVLAFVRIPLYIIAVLSDIESLNLLAVLITTLALLIYMSHYMVYENKYVCALEMLLYSNVILFCLSGLYLRSYVGKNELLSETGAVICYSLAVGSAFIYFVVVIVIQLRILKVVQNWLHKRTKATAEENSNRGNDSAVPCQTQASVSMTTCSVQNVDHTTLNFRSGVM